MTTVEMPPPLPRAGDMVRVLADCRGFQLGCVVGWYANDESSVLVRLADGAVERVPLEALSSTPAARLVV